MAKRFLLRELTPKNMGCGIGLCPAIYEVTPESMKCGVGACPSIHSTEEYYIIRGTKDNLRNYGIESEAGENEVDIREEITKRLAASLARRSAVGYGRSMQPEEIRELLDQLFACSEPALPGDGKAVFKILPTEDLDKLFN